MNVVGSGVKIVVGGMKPAFVSNTVSQFVQHHEHDLCCRRPELDAPSVVSPAPLTYVPSLRTPCVSPKYGKRLCITSSEASIHFSLCWVMFSSQTGLFFPHQGLVVAPDTLVHKFPDWLVLRFPDLPACFTDPSVLEFLHPSSCFTN